MLSTEKQNAALKEVFAPLDSADMHAAKQSTADNKTPTNHAEQWRDRAQKNVSDHAQSLTVPKGQPAHSVNDYATSREMKQFDQELLEQNSNSNNTSLDGQEKGVSMEAVESSPTANQNIISSKSREKLTVTKTSLLLKLNKTDVVKDNIKTTVNHQVPKRMRKLRKFRFSTVLSSTRKVSTRQHGRCSSSCSFK